MFLLCRGVPCGVGASDVGFGESKRKNKKKIQ